MTRRFVTIAICGLLLFFAGCKTPSKTKLYEGGRRSGSELSIVTVAPELDVARVNDKKFFTFLEKSGAKQLELAPGVNLLKVRFVGSYGEEAEGTEIIRSGDRTIELALGKGTRYRLESKKPSDREAAERYVDGPLDLWLVDQKNGERIDLRPNDAGIYVPVTALPGSNEAWAASEAAAATAAKTSTSETAAPAAASAAAATSATASAASQEKSLVLEELERWWDRADAQDRARFREQICPGNP